MVCPMFTITEDVDERYWVSPARWYSKKGIASLGLCGKNWVTYNVDRKKKKILGLVCLKSKEWKMQPWGIPFRRESEVGKIPFGCDLWMGKRGRVGVCVSWQQNMERGRRMPGWEWYSLYYKFLLPMKNFQVCFKGSLLGLTNKIINFPPITRVQDPPISCLIYKLVSHTYNPCQELSTPKTHIP